MRKREMSAPKIKSSSEFIIHLINCYWVIIVKRFVDSASTVVCALCHAHIHRQMGLHNSFALCSCSSSLHSSSLSRRRSRIVYEFQREEGNREIIWRWCRIISQLLFLLLLSSFFVVDDYECWKFLVLTKFFISFCRTWKARHRQATWL